MCHVIICAVRESSRVAQQLVNILHEVVLVPVEIWTKDIHRMRFLFGQQPRSRQIASSEVLVRVKKDRPESLGGLKVWKCGGRGF